MLRLKLKSERKSVTQISLDEAVHIAVKADLLAVEIAGVVEKTAVDEIERQKEQRRRQGAQAHTLSFTDIYQV